MTKLKILIFFIIPFFIQCSSGLTQNNSVKNNLSLGIEEEININKWKNATIHLESATDSKTFEEQQNINRDNLNHLQSGEISLEEYSRRSYTGKDVRFRGSALFIEYDNKKYLVTARHVLHDTLGASRYLKLRREFYNKAQITLTNDDYKKLLIESEKEIFNIIFRVPKLDEIINEKGKIATQEFLMVLQAGGYDYAPYTFSKPELDLAVISLEADSRTKPFLIDLEKNGYKPIIIDSLSTKSIKEGDEIFCIGYPKTTSPLYRINLPKAMANWSSSLISLPTISFGNIAMLHQILPFYWGDISVYPGNSGGPVIKNDNLIGIVSEQAILDKQRIPFAKIIKIEYLLDIIKQQQIKDNYWLD